MSVPSFWENSPVSGRAEFAVASSREVNRTMAKKSPPSVTPNVPPSQPIAPAPSPSRQVSARARTSAAREVFALITWMNMPWPPVRQAISG